MAKRKSVPWRTQPSSIEDPPEGEAPLDYKGVDTEPKSGITSPPRSRQGLSGGQAPGLDTDDYFQDGEEEAEGAVTMVEPGDEDRSDEDEPQPDWLQRAKDALSFSTTWLDSNWRQNIEDSLRAFHNQHPSSSKYNSETFRKRSNLYRPKTRSIIRKNEAAAAQAFFSNQDLIDFTAGNPSDKKQIASADVMKEVIQQRLTNSIDWYKIAIGGIQDAQVQGVVVGHLYWRHTMRRGADGTLEPWEDRPVIELKAIETQRFDPCADWMDPVGTSPYWIDMIPMYVYAVKERMRHPDPKGTRWQDYDDAIIAGAAANNADDSTRAARLNMSQDPTQQPRTISDYDIVWVHRHIHKWNGNDWEFYTLASMHLLTDPVPLVENVWHGERPYVLGCFILETHTPMPSSLPTLTRPLQDEVNDITNQRSDNVKFVLNKGHLVKRGKNVDTAALVRNVPGRVVLVDDPEKDVKEQTWPDVTQSAYLEEDRVNANFDDLAGNFSPNSPTNGRNPRESFGTIMQVQSPANLMTEYGLLTYTKTFLLPVVKQLTLLEQFYETDQTILAIAGEKSKVLQRFPDIEVNDALLEHRMNVTINMGMGSTNPITKLARFTGAIETFAKVSVKPPPGVDLKEVLKELLALAGYPDGIRFMSDQDPDKARMQQMLQAATRKIMQLELQVKNREGANEAKIKTTRESNITKLVIAGKGHDQKDRHLLVGHLMKKELAQHRVEAAAAQATQQQQANPVAA